MFTYANNSTYFNRTDNLGTPRLSTDYTGAVQRTEGVLMGPFGDGFSGTLSTLDFAGFADGFWDSENNSDHFGAREYAKTQGRWLIPDPAGLAAVNPRNPQTWNRYAYVGNNPVTFNDPLGLEMCDPTSAENSTCVDVTASMPPGPDALNDPLANQIGIGSGLAQGPSGFSWSNFTSWLKSKTRKGINSTWSKTLPCNRNAQQVMSAVQNDMGQFADNAGTVFAANFPDQPLTQGGQYTIQPGFNGHNGSVIPAPGNWLVASPGYLNVTVTSESPNGWTFTTDPSQHFLDGTVSFSATDDGNGNVNFSITAQGTYTSNFWSVLSPVINAGENSTWNNMLNNVQGYCQLTPSGK